MSGFAKIAVLGQAGDQQIVNVFYYRSNVYNPLAGNPFEGMQDVLNVFWDNVSTSWLFAHPDAYVCQRLEGIGFNDGMQIIEGSNAVRTIQLPGTGTGSGFDSYGHTANITWVCGAQHQITGLGSSQRNRGTTSIGPVASNLLTDDNHFVGTYISADVNNAANALRLTLVDVLEWATLVPIRLHKAVTAGITTGTTYSDILGYRLPTVAGFRRSRLGEF